MLCLGDEIKFVIADRVDFDWVLEIVTGRGLVARGLPILLAPVFGELTLPTLAEWILAAELPLRLQPQLHRLIWPDRDRGV